MPGFFVALLLMYLFSLKLGWFPVMGSGQGWKSIVLPTLTLAIAMSAKYTRQIRATVLEELKKYNSEDVYIIGGDSIYKEFLPYCDVAHVTRTDHVYDADAWFPNLEEDPAWVLTGESEEKTYFDLEFRFCRYERREA